MQHSKKSGRMNVRPIQRPLLRVRHFSMVRVIAEEGQPGFHHTVMLVLRSIPISRATSGIILEISSHVLSMSETLSIHFPNEASSHGISRIQQNRQEPLLLLQNQSPLRSTQFL